MLNRKCTICSVSKPFSILPPFRRKSEHIADIFLGTCPTVVEDSGFMNSYSVGVTDVPKEYSFSCLLQFVLGQTP